MKTMKIYREANKEKLALYYKEYYRSHKKEKITYNKKRKKDKPWTSNLDHARNRCNNTNDPKYKYYGMRGIRCNLSIEDVEYLWFKCEADKIEGSVCLHRIDSTRNYSIDNCIFLPVDDHNRIHKTH